MIITDIEKTITTVTKWLVNLKIETDGLHIYGFFLLFISNCFEIYIPYIFS